MQTAGKGGGESGLRQIDDTQNRQKVYADIPDRGRGSGDRKVDGKQSRHKE